MVVNNISIYNQTKKLNQDNKITKTLRVTLKTIFAISISLMCLFILRIPEFIILEKINSSLCYIINPTGNLNFLNIIFDKIGYFHLSWCAWLHPAMYFFQVIVSVLRYIYKQKKQH